jgi:hypothetical protein
VVRDANSRSDQIELAMLYVTGRRPTSGELMILSAALQRYEHRHSETEAIALVCSTILNLDEAVTSQ